MKEEDYEPIYDDSEDDYEPLYDDLDEEEQDDFDEQTYMDGLSNEGSYEEMQSIPDKIDSVKSSIQNINDQRQKIQDYFKNRNNDQNAKQRLNARNANTQAKKVEANQATNEVAKEAAKEGAKEGAKEIAKEGAKEGAKEAAKEGAKKAASKAVEEGAKKVVQSVGSAILNGLKSLASSPYFWIILAIIYLIIMIPVFMAAYGDDDSENSDRSFNDIAYVEGYEACESITVVGSGTYKLEDYVAGVVHAEYGSAPFETKKALAVAARTYAINSTNNCTTAIGNSSARQNFSADYSENDMLAASETAGQVLTYDGEIFSTEYDSWYCKGSNTCTYTKKPDGTKHTVTLSDKYLQRAAGGHGRGMSQLAAADMADNGSKYDEILKYFYSDGVEIATISNKTSSNTLGEFVNGFQIRTSKPNYLSQPDSNYYKYIGSNTFQCPWYAKARAIEIISTMNNAIESKKRDAIEKITSATGHGSQWYTNAQGSGSMSMFASSNDVNQPRPGAMISWKWNNAGCLAYKAESGTCAEFGGKKINYGHVGIIESVNEKEKTVVVSDGWYNCSDWNNTSCMGFGSKTVSYDYLQSYGGNYIFLGYVYIADYVSGG